MRIDGIIILPFFCACLADRDQRTSGWKDREHGWTRLGYFWDRSIRRAGIYRWMDWWLNEYLRTQVAAREHPNLELLGKVVGGSLLFSPFFITPPII